MMNLLIILNVFHTSSQPFGIFLILLDISKSHESNYTLESVTRVCKQKIEMYNYLKNSLERSFNGGDWLFYNFKSFYNLIIFSRIMENRNGKVLKETLAGSSSNAVKTTLRGLRNFKMALPIFQVLKKTLATPQNKLK